MQLARASAAFERGVHAQTDAPLLQWMRRHVVGVEHDRQHSLHVPRTEGGTVEFARFAAGRPEHADRSRDGISPACGAIHQVAQILVRLSPRLLLVVEEHAEAVASATIPLQSSTQRPCLGYPACERGLLKGRGVDAFHGTVHNQGGFDQPTEVGVQVARGTPCGAEAKSPASAKLFELIIPRSEHVKGFGTHHPARGAVA